MKTDLLRGFSVSYFKKVRISAIALIKMTMHARSGGDIEVMGLMQVELPISPPLPHFSDTPARVKW
jgi:hypothetical protein